MMEVSPTHESGNVAVGGRRSWSTLAMLMLVTTAWFIAVSPGKLGTGDTTLRLQMTHAWLFGGPEVQHGLPTPTSRENIDNGVLGRNGHRYVFYDPGQSILMAPGDWVGTKIHRWIHTRDSKGLRVWTIELLVFLPSTLALVLTCYWLIRLLGFNQQRAALAALVWLTGTTVLPYVQISFQNNQVLLFTLLSFALILKHANRQSAYLLLLSGACAGITLLIRTSAAIHVLTAAMFLGATGVIAKAPLREISKRTFYWGLGVAPFFIAGRLFDYIRYGSFLTTGQSVWLAHINSDPIFSGMPPLPSNFPFVNPAHVGLMGVLFSPAKSIFIYDPLLIPAAIAAACLWKRFTPLMRAFAWVAVLNLALHMALTSKLDFWHGDWAWAARYHVSSVQLILVVLLPVLIEVGTRAGPSIAAAVKFVIALAIAVQLLAVAMPYNIDIPPELLEAPVMCNAEWTTRLEFRLGHRVQNLICLASGSASLSCPESVARQASKIHPECSGTVTELRQANRLAFFPFDPDHQLLSRQTGLAMWAIFAVGALSATIIWIAAGLRSTGIPKVNWRGRRDSNPRPQRS